MTKTCGRLISGMNSIFIVESEKMPNKASAISIIVSTGVCFTEKRDIFIRFLRKRLTQVHLISRNSALSR